MFAFTTASSWCLCKTWWSCFTAWFENVEFTWSWSLCLQLFKAEFQSKSIQTQNVKRFKILFIVRFKLYFLIPDVQSGLRSPLYICVWETNLEKKEQKERSKQSVKCLSRDRWCKAMSYFWPLTSKPPLYPTDVNLLL